MSDARATTNILPTYAGFGAALAFAGPPIYIHAPNLYAVEYGIGLAAIGGVLLGLRALDFVQDPLLGWWIGRTAIVRRLLAAGFAALLGFGALALFWPLAVPDQTLRFALALAAVFTGFSALQILFYASGVAIAKARAIDHSRLAGWREAGVLLGVCAACVLPEILRPMIGAKAAFGAFAGVFCLVLLAASVGMWRRWPERLARSATDASGFKACFRDPELRRLLAIGLVNALPTGLTATLFLFFVEDRLDAVGHAGPILLLFFLAAALTAPFWGRLARRFGEKPVLLAAMAGAIAVFALALTLGAGDVYLFYPIAIASGAAMGADMTLLPAMLSRRLDHIGESGEAAFGGWGFVNKAALALAAGLAFPVLGLAGYQPGVENAPDALFALALAYAGAPCLLKVLAMIALALSPITNTERRS